MLLFLPSNSWFKDSSANFLNPKIGLDIIKGIESYMDREGIKSLDEIRGIL